MPNRYFSLRSRLGPPPSDLPVLVLCTLVLVTVVGLFVDLAI